HVQRHGALRRVEHEQLAPRHAQQGHLVGELEVWEEGDALGPLDGTEEEAGGQLADVLDAHDVTGLQALGPVAGRGVGLGPQQQRD
ncbi:hypothetical protein N309_14323, partial [Tinamus guttatus]